MRFEYLVQTVERGHLADDQIQEQLNSHGKDGWELVGSFMLDDRLPRFVMKRQRSD